MQKEEMITLLQQMMANAQQQLAWSTQLLRAISKDHPVDWDSMYRVATEMVDRSFATPPDGELTIGQWLAQLDVSTMSTRLYGLLKEGRFLDRRTGKWTNYYARDVKLRTATWQNMRHLRNFGRTSWNEFVKFRGY